MNSGILPLLVFGGVALLVATAFLVAMVQLELAPIGGLAGKKRWLLGAALGTGVAAFAFKLALIVVLLQLPRPTTPRVALSMERSPAVEAPQSRRLVWQPLPGEVREASLPLAAEPHFGVWEALPERAPEPAGNPATPEKVALGKRLFFDKALSRDGTLACSSCHDVEGGSGGDGRATALGIDGQIGTRNSPTVWNAAFQSALFWDGRAESLEEQAKGPLVNPAEMGMPSLAEVERRVAQDPGYRAAFSQAFGSGEPITIDRIAAAIAAYERTLITPDAPYDRFVRGDLTALTPAQLRGMALFQSFGCVTCHAGPNFSAASLSEQQAPLRLFPAHPTPDDERYRLTEDSGAARSGSGAGTWRIPSLRNVALTAPYFHNGAVTELSEAVRIMASAQLGRTGRYLVWSEQEKVLREIDRLAPSGQEIEDLVAFLHGLSSDTLATRIAHTHPKPGLRYASR